MNFDVQSMFADLRRLIVKTQALKMDVLSTRYEIAVQAFGPQISEATYAALTTDIMETCFKKVTFPDAKCKHEREVAVLAILIWHLDMYPNIPYLSFVFRLGRMRKQSDTFHSILTWHDLFTFAMHVYCSDETCPPAQTDWSSHRTVDYSWLAPHTTSMPALYSQTYVDETCAHPFSRAPMDRRAFWFMLRGIMLAKFIAETSTTKRHFQAIRFAPVIETSIPISVPLLPPIHSSDVWIRVHQTVVASFECGSSKKGTESKTFSASTAEPAALPMSPMGSLLLPLPETPQATASFLLPDDIEDRLARMDDIEPQSDQLV